MKDEIMDEDELYKMLQYWQDQYEKKFGDTYPTIPSNGAEDLIEGIKKCIETGIPAESGPDLMY